MKRLYAFPSRFIKGFIDDDGYLWASALSFYTLLAIVPALAIVFGIAKGFGFERALETQILETFYQQAAFADKLIAFAKSALENAHGSLIAGLGIIFLFWSSLGLLGSFESALNKIWDVPNSRSFHDKIVAYLPILIFGPIFIIAASSLTYLITTKIVEFTVEQGVYTSIKPAIHFTYYILLILLNWALFQYLYTYIPNKKIPWKTNILASLISATSIQIMQWAYIHLQIYLTSYNAIYGSLAAVPLFLIWLQISWLIILAGAEIAKQQSILVKHAIMPISERGLFLLSLLICCKAYSEKMPPYTIEKLSDTLSIDYALSKLILMRFRDSGLLLEVMGKDTKGFIPAMPPDKIMIHDVFTSVDDAKDPLFHVSDSLERNQIMHILHNWDAEQKNLQTNMSIEQIYNKQLDKKS